jgi:hypothetical protein
MSPGWRAPRTLIAIPLDFGDELNGRPEGYPQHEIREGPVLIHPLATLMKRAASWWYYAVYWSWYVEGILSTCRDSSLSRGSSYHGHLLGAPVDRGFPRERTRSGDLMKVATAGLGSIGVVVTSAWFGVPRSRLISR